MRCWKYIIFFEVMKYGLSIVRFVCYGWERMKFDGFWVFLLWLYLMFFFYIGVFSRDKLKVFSLVFCNKFGM